MKKFLFKLFGFAGRFFGKLSRISRGLASRWEPADNQEQIVIGSTRYDMVAAPDEPYYAKQYWSVMRPYLEAFPGMPKLLIWVVARDGSHSNWPDFFPRARWWVVICQLRQLPKPETMRPVNRWAILIFGRSRLQIV